MSEPNYAEVRFMPHGAGPLSRRRGRERAPARGGAGLKAAKLLFPGRPMLGETITINGTEFTVVGAWSKISRGNNDYRRPEGLHSRHHDAGTLRAEGRQLAAGRADLDPVPAGDAGRRDGGRGGGASRDCRAARLRPIDERRIRGVGHDPGRCTWSAPSSTRWIFFWAAWAS